ncbi:MAG: alpha-L-arabinofuranosidase C-terminal domain-containing protein [Armatimonadota bacterium]|nr:alpha-L-arabinofuranosidase C-terminal domain-containing protein [Armatimonadota bacterium]
MRQTESKPIVEFKPGDKPQIEVFAGEKSKPISPYLFGKFTENLGNNIYHGFWAQILRNSGFEPSKYFSHHGEKGLERKLAHSGISEVWPDLLESHKAGVACFWARWGTGNVSYSLSTDRINSETSQRIEIRSLSTPQVGILQPIYLPIHRTCEYEFTVWAKGTIKELHAIIRTLDGKDLGGAKFSVNPSWQKCKGKLTIRRNGVERGQPLLLTIGAKEKGEIFLDQCFLFPTDNVEGFDPDILHFLKESKLTMLRFPGGNFVSGYHWQDGVGPLDERPMRVNPAWDQEEPNHVGTDEHLALCRLLGCEPLICINAGNGTPEEAAQWVEYCNGGLDTELGKLRAKNGHPEPYGVKYWEIGNELYGSWQIGNCTPEEYAERYRRFYEAMYAVDSNIKFIANGQDLNWNKPIIEKNADILRSLSTHQLRGAGIPAETDPEIAYKAFMAFPFWFEAHLHEMARQMAEGGIRVPTIALTELQIHTHKPQLPNNQTLSEALLYAGMVNAAIRSQGIVEIITHSALVNHGGGLRKQREFVYPNPVYWAHRMYASQSGRTPVKIHITGPKFSVAELADLPAWNDAPWLDAIALLDETGKEMNILVSNRHPKDPLTVDIALHDFQAEGEAFVETLTGDDFMAMNTFDEPEAVKPIHSTTGTHSTGFTRTFPPNSLVRLRLKKS